MQEVRTHFNNDLTRSSSTPINHAISMLPKTQQNFCFVFTFDCICTKCSFSLGHFLHTTSNSLCLFGALFTCLFLARINSIWSYFLFENHEHFIGRTFFCQPIFPDRIITWELGSGLNSFYMKSYLEVHWLFTGNELIATRWNFYQEKIHRNIKRICHLLCIFIFNARCMFYEPVIINMLKFTESTHKTGTNFFQFQRMFILFIQHEYYRLNSIRAGWSFYIEASACGKFRIKRQIA